MKIINDIHRTYYPTILAAFQSEKRTLPVGSPRGFRKGAKEYGKNVRVGKRVEVYREVSERKEREQKS